MGPLPSRLELGLNAETFGHLFVKKPFFRGIGLKPLAVDYELRDGALPGPFNHLVGGSRSGFDVDVGIGKFVLVQKALGCPTIRTPRGRIESDFHELFEFRRFRASCQTRCSSWTVRSFSIFPVFSVVAGSNSITQHSSSATGR